MLIKAIKTENAHSVMSFKYRLPFSFCLLLVTLQCLQIVFKYFVQLHNVICGMIGLIITTQSLMKEKTLFPAFY